MSKLDDWDNDGEFVCFNWHTINYSVSIAIELKFSVLIALLIAVEVKVGWPSLQLTLFDVAQNEWMVLLSL